jgi:hypothetical protein
VRGNSIPACAGTEPTLAAKALPIEKSATIANRKKEAQLGSKDKVRAVIGRLVSFKERSIIEIHQKPELEKPEPENPEPEKVPKKKVPKESVKSRLIERSRA